MNEYLVFILGVVAGLALTKIFSFTLCEHGDFVLSRTEEGKLSCRLEIEKLVGIDKKKYVILKVKNVPHKSQTLL